MLLPLQACDLILKLKVSDDPNSDITEAKRIYNQTGDAKKSCEVFNKNRNKCLEYKLLEGLSKNGPNDYVNSLENVCEMKLIFHRPLYKLIVADSKDDKTVVHTFFAKFNLESNGV